MSCYSVSDPATTPSWSDLPIDLLDFIAERLDSQINVKRFRGACSSWRNYTKPPQENSNFPLLPYPLYNSNISQRDDTFKLCETSIYRLHPSNIELDYKQKFYVVDKKGFVLVLNYFFEIVRKILSPDVSDEHVPGFWEDNPHYLISTREELCKRLSDPKLF
ncbi:hypothetical protein ACFE04_023829 [Oxalis oulophora]